MKARKIQDGESRFLDRAGLCAYTAMGRTSAIRLAKECGAVLKIGKTVRYDKHKIDLALDRMLDGSEGGAAVGNS